jgi:hypothetical protein
MSCHHCILLVQYFHFNDPKFHMSVYYIKNTIQEVLYMLLLIKVLSNTSLDDKTDQIQVMTKRRRYKNVEYDDDMIEYLMKYLGCESYEQLQDFLKHSHIPLYN